MCFKSNETLYGCDATVFLNVCIYLVFVGEGWVALLPSHLPHLRELGLVGSFQVDYEELKAAHPKLYITTTCMYDYSHWEQTR